MYIWLVIVMTSSIVTSSCIKFSRQHDFSSLFAAGDGLRGGTSSGHEVPNIFLCNFTSLLGDFEKVLCSCADELQQTQMLLLENTIFYKY